MDADIEFGDVHASGPTICLRPDEHHYFSVAATGPIDPQDLPIFVDLDVMRELEQHAASNLDVELGGVLMGRQSIDASGAPFVVVEDSIRASFYEATRGSFKFTHETWEQITRDRQRLPRSVQMVGWYHTHPGWGIFLSGMDNFICENFFNRSLDVALVIDPRANERGWFYWTDQGTTRRCQSFYLMAHRGREEELHRYVEALNERGTMMTGLRSQSGRSSGAETTTVQVIERPQRTDWTVIALLTMQFLALLIVLLRITPPYPLTVDSSANVDGQTNRETVRRLEMQNAVLKETLALLANDPAAVQRTVEELSEARLSKAHDSAAIASHVARISELERSLESSTNSLRAAENEVQSLRRQVDELRTRTAKTVDGLEFSWVQEYGIWFFVGGLVVALGSVLAVAWRLNKNRQESEFSSSGDDEQSATRPTRL